MKIEVQKVPKKTLNSEDLIATFCIYYPQYKFHEARLLPARRLSQMLKVALKHEAKKMFELTQIVAAPHTKKMTSVKKLSSYYQGAMQNG